MAVAKENIEVLKLLLACPKIDVNMKSISHQIFFLMSF